MRLIGMRGGALKRHHELACNEKAGIRERLFAYELFPSRGEKFILSWNREWREARSMMNMRAARNISAGA